MGCGKSTIGHETARVTGRKFVDTDLIVEEKNNITISEIFDKYGEEYFRKLETEVIKELEMQKSYVISLGGGAINDVNLKHIKKNGIVVYLEVEFETCYHRIKHSDRPIVKNSTKEELFELFNKRIVNYKANCNWAINAENSPFDIAKSISKILMT
jgi:shikimate kinase